MIIVEITSGLGNQMFQYAAAKALSLHHKTEMKLDLTWFEKHDDREFGLDSFHIDSKTMHPIAIYKCKILSRLAHTSSAFSSITMFDETKELNSESLLTCEKDIFLRGYFQSHHYFLECDSIIRDTFRLKKSLSSTALHFADLITKCNSVSIHVRRSDYVTLQHTLSLDYYRLAIENILCELDNPTFFLFTDDPCWVSENFPIGLHKSCMVSENGLSDYEELELMKKCQHNIIANSTFSWWGAWLNPNPRKIVIAPKNWPSQYANQSKSICLICSEFLASSVS
jgi:hypothetical protein